MKACIVFVYSGASSDISVTHMSVNICEEKEDAKTSQGKSALLSGGRDVQACWVETIA